MWYKIKILPYDDNNIFSNYLCYDNKKGFYIGTRSQGRFFKKEHLLYDKKLISYLSSKKYELEECKGNYSFYTYKGDIS